MTVNLLINQLVLYIGSLMVLFVILWAPGTFARSYYAAKAGQKAVFDLRTDLDYRILRMSASFFERNKSGSIVSRTISDVALAQNLVGSALTNVWMDGTAIDATSEKLIQDALEKLRIGRTTLIIAHRLSTIINADKIIVLDDGEIVEMGTHDELLQHGGVYHSLYMQQFALALSLPAPAVASAGGGGPKNGRGADVDPVPVGRLPVVER